MRVFMFTSVIFCTPFSPALAQTGNVGIGTTNPQARLHVLDSSVLFSSPGDVPPAAGAAPLSGAGRRLLWFAGKAAFRAGHVDGDQWDAGNIGAYSFAAGQNTRASGVYATALGQGTVASGSHSTAAGLQTQASGSYATALGLGSTANGSAALATGTSQAGGAYAFAAGAGARAFGAYSTALGLLDSANGEASIAVGKYARANGEASAAIGKYTVASGEAATAVGLGATASGLSSITMGQGSTASGAMATAMGLGTLASGEGSFAAGNTTTASGRNSVATGFLATASGNYSVAMGTFVSTNNLSGSFVLGDTATTTITGASAANQLTARFAGGYRFFSNAALSRGVSIAAGSGRLGIGTFAPLAGLDIVEDTFGMRTGAPWDNLWMTVNGSTANINASGAEAGLNFKVGANSSGTYGNGQTLTTVMTMMPGGNVGIGTTTPNALLQFGNTQGNRKLVLYDGNNNNHQYYGFGINASALRYQTDGPGSDHVFYAANGPASSTELLRIQGTGGIQAAGVVTAGGVRLPSAGGTPATLDHYEEGSFEVSFRSIANNVTYLSSYTIRVLRVGKQVTLTFPASVTNLNVSGGLSISEIPQRFRPSNDRFLPIIISNGGSVRPGMAQLLLNGSMHIWPADQQYSIGGANTGIFAGSITYSVQ